MKAFLLALLAPTGASQLFAAPWRSLQCSPGMSSERTCGAFPHRMASLPSGARGGARWAHPRCRRQLGEGRTPRHWSRLGLAASAACWSAKVFTGLLTSPIPPTRPTGGARSSWGPASCVASPGDASGVCTQPRSPSSSRWWWPPHLAGWPAWTPSRASHKRATSQRALTTSH